MCNPCQWQDLMSTIAYTRARCQTQAAAMQCIDTLIRTADTTVQGINKVRCSRAQTTTYQQLWDVQVGPVQQKHQLLHIAMHITYTAPVLTRTNTPPATAANARWHIAAAVAYAGSNG